MRIALHAGGRRIRGNERQLELLVRGLVGRGHRVAAATVAGSPTSEALAAAGAVVTGVRPRGDLDPVSLVRFAGWLRRVRPDALLATSWKRAAAVLLAGRLAGVPRVVFRMGGPHAHAGRLGDRVRARALGAWLDAAYANSAALRDQLLAYAPGLAPERVAVVPNAIAPAAAAAAPLRAELGLAADVPLVLSVGGLERNKGGDLLLRAFALLPRADAHLVLAGAGGERRPLAELATALAVAGRVHFLGHRSDVAGLLRACDAFALASRVDSTPNAVLEAMDAGLPVVSTATAGLSDLLGTRPGRPAAGWVAPIDDAPAVARCLAEALTCAGAERGREALRRVREEHAPERMVAAVEALLAP